MNEITTQEIAQAVRTGTATTFELLFRCFKQRALKQWPSRMRFYETAEFSALRGLDRLIQKARKEGLIEYDKKLRRWRAL